MCVCVCDLVCKFSLKECCHLLTVSSTTTSSSRARLDSSSSSCAQRPFFLLPFPSFLSNFSLSLCGSDLRSLADTSSLFPTYFSFSFSVSRHLSRHQDLSVRKYLPTYLLLPRCWTSTTTDSSDVESSFFTLKTTPRL